MMSQHLDGFPYKIEQVHLLHIPQGYIFLFQKLKIALKTLTKVKFNHHKFFKVTAYHTQYFFSRIL